MLSLSNKESSESVHNDTSKTKEEGNSDEFIHQTIRVKQIKSPKSFHIFLLYNYTLRIL